MTTAYLSLGSNLGNRRGHLLAAIAQLRASRAIDNIRVAHFYETQPVGGVIQDNFLNTAVAVETELSADQLLASLHRLEYAEHRRRFVHWGPRTLDIDIIFFGDEHMHTNTLTIPHPEAPNRKFVLVPLLEISGPDRQIQRQLVDWLAETNDQTEIIKLGSDA